MDMLQEQEEWEKEEAGATAAKAVAAAAIAGEESGVLASSSSGAVTPAKQPRLGGVGGSVEDGGVGEEESSGAIVGYEGGVDGGGEGGERGDAAAENEDARASVTPRKKPAVTTTTATSPYSVPGIPARGETAAPVAVSRVGAASARLAADILQGSDLGRAYHPLLASIEARLLHLSQNVNVAFSPDVSVA
jgi:hypothetical protein